MVEGLVGLASPNLEDVECLQITKDRNNTLAAGAAGGGHNLGELRFGQVCGHPDPQLEDLDLGDDRVRVPQVGPRNLGSQFMGHDVFKFGDEAGIRACVSGATSRDEGGRFWVELTRASL